MFQSKMRKQQAQENNMTKQTLIQTLRKIRMGSKR